LFKGVYFRTEELYFFKTETPITLKKFKGFIEKPDKSIYVTLPLSFLKGMFCMLFDKDETIHTQAYSLAEQSYGLQLTKDGSTLSAYRPIFFPIHKPFLKHLPKANKKASKIKCKELQHVLDKYTPDDTKRLTAIHLVTLKALLGDDYTAAMSIRLLHIKRLLAYASKNDLSTIRVNFVNDLLYIFMPDTYLAIACLESPLED